MNERERRALYRSAAWLRIRQLVLARDSYLCQPCLRRQQVTPANTAHHVRNVEEAPELALDPDNLESVCEACHNLAHPEKGFGAVGLRRRIVVVLGYPAAGKTTYAREMMGEYDIILDLDALVVALTGREMHDRSGAAGLAVAIANDMIKQIVRDVRSRGYQFDALWIIRTRLSDEELSHLRAARARLYWLDTDRDTCRQRLAAQGRESAIEAFDKCDEFLARHGARVQRIPPSPQKSTLA